MLTLSLDHLTGLLFVATYVGIALGRIPGLRLDRTGIALVGAIALVAVGAISLPHATAAVDFSTLFLLFGLMILSAQLRLAGFYRLVAGAVLRQARRPLRLLSGVVVASAALSSLFANDIVCLAFTPVLCEAVRAAGRNPVPYLIALATASNIGSVATLIGNPQNMFIGQVAQLDFAHYTLAMLPVAALGVVANVAVVALVWRRELLAPKAEVLDLPVPVEVATLTPDRYLIAKTLGVTALLLAAFLLGLPRDVSALTAAAFMLCSRRTPSRQLYALVDWNLILLFMGLFVVIGALQERSLMRQALAALAAHGVVLTAPGVFVAVCTILANLVSNVPAVLLLRDVPGTSLQLWYLLAMASTLAGNLTLVGSIANLIVVEKAADSGVTVSFAAYARVGVPLTAVTLLLGTLWLVAVT
ncbi:MAG: anion transporter [Candidatus Tectimicrobiota bacterium]|nr:MAG: anion transporter [Candidatus Tectomicrobia bacterium]